MMSIKFHNTLTRKLDEFVPLEEKTVKIYSCGPTVYDYAHIGNFRSYVFTDLLRRFLKYKGFKVIQVMNITDVDDKTIKRSQEQKVSLKEYTDRFTNAFFEDLKTLGIERADYYPRATEHINEMIDLIKRLDSAGYTYLSDGSVYFKISQFKEYGRLSRVDLANIKQGVRVDLDEYTKDDVKDFVLWKGKKEGEPFWDTPYGPGRPGWHIECSAMSMKYLGETFDIHTGGEDLIFPHHENEIAQSVAATGKPFVKYWLHCSHLIVEGEKMSKSKGNFFTLRDLINRGASSKAIRYLLLSTHYRKQLNFTKESLNAAHAAIDKLQNFYQVLLDHKPSNNSDEPFQKALTELLGFFDANLEDDLNISGCLGYLFDLMSETNRFMDSDILTQNNKNSLIQALHRIDSILNILKEPEKELPEEIKVLIGQREKARKDKDFKLADEIRQKLKEKSVLIEDTKEGIRWKILK
ncbi:MAG: cysteine--tRNA ligase [bacterium]|nr:cysteine--tRNA ligase [bacterium]